MADFNIVKPAGPTTSGTLATLLITTGGNATDVNGTFDSGAKPMSVTAKVYRVADVPPDSDHLPTGGAGGTYDATTFKFDKVPGAIVGDDNKLVVWMSFGGKGGTSAPYKVSHAVKFRGVAGPMM